MKTKINKSKPPKTVTKEFWIDPEQGIACLVRFAPDGYLIKKVDRNKTKAIVTYELV